MWDALPARAPVASWFLCRAQRPEISLHHKFTSAVIVSVMVKEKGKQAAGKKEGHKPWTLREFGGKMVWDWMDLLIVPIMLALITVVFTGLQNDRQQDLEAQRADRERTVEDQRSQDAALQAYLDSTSDLLLNEQGTQLVKLDPDTKAQRLIQGRTDTLLETLDSSRQVKVVLFLAQADLIPKKGPLLASQRLT